jgi:hypothetical protein
VKEAPKGEKDGGLIKEEEEDAKYRHMPATVIDNGAADGDKEASHESNEEEEEYNPLEDEIDYSTQAVPRITREGEEWARREWNNAQNGNAAAPNDATIQDDPVITIENVTVAASKDDMFEDEIAGEKLEV